MPILSTMGLKKIYVSELKGSEAGALPAFGEGWVDLGDVYQDTCKLIDSDPEQTVHRSETSKKKITLTGEYETTVELTLMDPDLDQLAKYFGGEIAPASKGQRKWKRPMKLPYKEWAVLQQPEEGIFIGCANARIIPKFEITYSAKGICLVPMKIIYQSELLTDETIEDPTQPGGKAPGK